MSFEIALWVFNIIMSGVLFCHAGANKHYRFCMVFFASFLVSSAALVSVGYGA